MTSAPSAVAATAAIRSYFPALARVHNGNPVAYFDGPGGTQVPAAVASAMIEYLFNHNANTHWEYPTSAETDALLAGARATFADFFNGDADDVSFGANMTTITFHLARALGRGWGPGDEIVVTELDHHANRAPWEALAKERGVAIRVVRVLAQSGQLDREDLRRAITARTRLVAIGAASNALGTVSDVQEAARLAHERGALCFVDAVHYAPHVLPDVRELGCDFLACSAYKFCGPHLGILYGRRELVERLDVPKLDPAPAAAPDRLETGTQNHEGICGAAAAVEFFASLSPGGSRRERLARTFEALHHRGQALIASMWEGLRAIDGVTVYGPDPGQPRTPTLSFAVEGVAPAAVTRALAERGVFTSHGDFYATTLIERLGRSPDGLVRAGCACYTLAEEVERLVRGVREVRSRLQ